MSIIVKTQMQNLLLLLTHASNLLLSLQNEKYKQAT